MHPMHPMKDVRVEGGSNLLSASTAAGKAKPSSTPHRLVPPQSYRKGWRFVPTETQRPTSPLVSLREAAQGQEADAFASRMALQQRSGGSQPQAWIEGRNMPPASSSSGGTNRESGDVPLAASIDGFGIPGRRMKTGYTPPKRNMASSDLRHSSMVAKNRGKLTARLQARNSTKHANSTMAAADEDHSLAPAKKTPLSGPGTRIPESKEDFRTSQQSEPATRPRTPSNAVSKSAKRRASRRRPATASVNGRDAISVSSSAGFKFPSSNAKVVRRDVAQMASTKFSVLSASRRTDPLLRIMTQKQVKRDDLAESLLIAAERGDALKVDQLLVQGAPVNARGRKGLEGFTALHYASSRGHIVVAERLVRAGKADLEAANKDGEVPLHMAAYGGYLTIVELLLDSGAKVDVGNEYGETPLFYAARKGYAAVARLLLQRGADLSKKSRFGDSVLEDCKNSRVKDVLQNSERNQSDKVGSYSTGRLGQLSTRVLRHVFGMLGARGLGVVAAVDGRCHRVVESQDLWQNLGVSRWELAVRASFREQTGGSSVAPLLATYRPSSLVNPAGSAEGKLPNSARRADLSEGSRRGANLSVGWGEASESGRTANVSPTRTALGLTMDIFLSDNEYEY